MEAKNIMKTQSTYQMTDLYPLAVQDIRLAVRQIEMAITQVNSNSKEYKVIQSAMMQILETTYAKYDAGGKEWN